jgi:hypothetical protein
VPSGTYYLIVRADGADELAEANEDNNTGNLNVSLGPTNCVSGSLQPIAWWPADGNTRDAVGSNDAALQGLAGFGLGEVGLAFTGLDGQANYVRVPYSDTFNLLGKSHTMENWVRIHRVGNLVLLTPMQAGGIGGLWYRNDGLMEAEVWFAPTDRRGLNFWRGLPTDVWLHVAQVFDASSSALFIYVNGTLAGSGINWSDQPDFGVNNPILFGKGYTENDNGYTFLADYDEIAIYDRVLSAAEIHSIYAAGSRGRKCWPSLVIPLAISNPDLLPTNLLAPASAPPSSTIEVAWTVANQGVGLANPPWVDRIYLSTDQVLDTSDRLLAEVPHGQPLLGGTNYAQVQTVSLSGVAEGTYYLLLVADAGNAVLESSETNNLQALRIEVRSPAVVQTVLRSLSAADAGFGNLGSLDFSPDGVQLTVAAGSTALIWDVQTGELRRRYYDHRGPIDTVDFSPAGDQVLSGARDGTARV